MKLRIKGNSIRLRLLRSEVERFAADGTISEEVNFGANSLKYTVSKSPDVRSIVSLFDYNEIKVLIPSTDAQRWTGSNEVGFEIEQAIEGKEPLSIVIEKDFVCIDRPDDPDREDAFPNPNQTCKPVQ